MRRIGIFSDIHGNCAALDAVLADMRADGLDEVICLGDVAQGGSQPAESVDRVRGLGCPVVMGNTDAWLVTGEHGGAEQLSERHLEVRDWSLAQLGEERLEFMGRFSSTVELDLDGGRRFLGFHGSPRSFDDVLLPDTPEDEFREFMSGFESLVYAGGHTHLQQVRRLDDGFFFNPGSVGVVYDAQQSPESFRFDAWAEYAVLGAKDGIVRLEFRRVPIDVDELTRATLRSGIPYGDGIVSRYAP